MLTAKFVFFVTGAATATQVLGPHIFFILWGTFPWIWFLSYANGHYVLIWYLLASTAAYELEFKKPIPRTLIFLWLLAVSCLTGTWHLLKTNREISLYVLLTVAIVVPLDPALDFLLNAIQGAANTSA
jgi:hypothetical protein